MDRRSRFLADFLAIALLNLTKLRVMSGAKLVGKAKWPVGGILGEDKWK